MKRFVLRLLLFFCILAVVDNLFGYSIEYFRNNVKGGATYIDNYICNELESDILLLGSSRCLHHYNPIIFEDSLKKTCYNAGLSGNGIIAAYSIYKMTSERRKVDLVIYDVLPDFDLLDSYDNHRYLTWLRSSYGKDCICRIFDSIDPTEKYKMISKLYSFNSRFLQIFIDYFHPKDINYIKGYAPYEKEMDKTKINEKEKYLDRGPYNFDSLKISYIDKLIDDCGSNNIIITISPRWYGLDKASYWPVVELCQKKGVKFIDFSNNPKYVHNDSFFMDGNHLNARGADEFTKDLIKYIK